MTDPVNNPKHYTSHPSGIECIQVTEHMGFNLGNAIKYIWRADLKGDALQDLEKARWYIEREIQRRRVAADTANAALKEWSQFFGMQACGVTASADTEEETHL